MEIYSLQYLQKALKIQQSDTNLTFLLRRSCRVSVFHTINSESKLIKVNKEGFNTHICSYTFV